MIKENFRKIFKVLAFVAVVILNCGSFATVFAVNERANWEAEYTSGPLQGQHPSGGLAANSDVTLAYNLEGTDPHCSSSVHKVYFGLYDVVGARWVKNGQANLFSYDFNSGSSNSQHKYEGDFYCFSSDIIASGSVTKPDNLGVAGGYVWRSSLFDMKTVQVNYSCNQTTHTCNEDPNGKDLAACQTECGITKKYSCNQTTHTCNEDPNGKDLAACRTECNPSGTSTPPSASDKLYNPLPSGDLITMFLVITKGFMATVGILGVLFIIIGGFMYVIAAGSEEMITKARKTITWAIIGVIAATLSFTIVSIVQNLLRANVTLVK